MSTSISEHARQEEEISPEARDAAVDEIYSYEDGGRPQGYHVQQAIDSATAANDVEIKALQARVRELKEALAWTLDHLDEGVEKIHHRKVTDCRQTLQP